MVLFSLFVVLYFGEGLRLGYYHYSLTEVSGEFFFKLRFLDPRPGDTVIME